MKQEESLTGSRFSRSQLFLSAVASLLILITVIKVPWNMDEFLAYHALACRETAQKLNIFRESCFAYSTNIGPIHFFRSYQYVGVASSILYAPFHALVNSIWTHYLVGALALVAIAWGLKSSLNFNRSMIPAFVLFFPLLFTVLHDSGPVRIGLIVMAWSPVFFVKCINSKRYPYVWLVLTSIMWMIATEDKPFFVFLIPGIILFCLAAAVSKEVGFFGSLDWKKVFLFFGIPTAMCLVLLTILRTEGSSYLTYLNQNSVPRGLGSFAAGLLTAVVFTVDWSFYAHRVTSLISILADEQDYSRKFAANTQFFPAWHTQRGAVALTLMLVTVLVLTSLLFWIVKAGIGQISRQVRQLPREKSKKRVSMKSKKAKGKFNHQNDWTLSLLIGSFSLLVLGIALAGGWAGHHFVYTSIPVLACIAMFFQNWTHGAVRLGVFFAILSTISLVVISLTPIQKSASREIDLVMQKAISSSDYSTIVNCASWGCYYPYSLLNKRNIPIVFATEVSDINKLGDVAQSRKSTVMHVCTSCDQDLVQKLYPTSRIEPIRTGTNLWLLFRVTP